MMKAVTYDSYGGLEVLQVRNFPRPKLPQNSVMVRVKAAGASPANLALRSGTGKDFMDAWFPIIPGWDVAGVVEAAGAGVTEFQVGDEVLGYLYSEILPVGSALAQEQFCVKLK
ncbi:alcohol dehydrogenase catalytic domain-containing protein [Oryzomonas rubra]|uniref:Alcohol dehydrogenase-like N-terminal domain-containing protein n=1 Tax=Oryzomonas rubra TaxID=2509454 RepID=A0A5A9X5F7_9BACT|nr:alcohol dehydrogenase catalytic domain-containing protein [Oryzomonas rubra]KAA0888307.1 hypothetical protein ET418_16345 [Oryzomonas rubra]